MDRRRFHVRTSVNLTRMMSSRLGTVMDTDVIRANVRHIAWPFGGWLHGAVAGRGLGRYQQQARAMAHVGGMVIHLVYSEQTTCQTWVGNPVFAYIPCLPLFCLVFFSFSKTRYFTSITKRGLNRPTGSSNFVNVIAF